MYKGTVRRTAPRTFANLFVFTYAPRLVRASRRRVSTTEKRKRFRHHFLASAAFAWSYIATVWRIRHSRIFGPNPSASR